MSIGLAVYAGFAVKTITSNLRDVIYLNAQANPVQFILAVGLLALALSSLLTLACISCAAGRDLWLLRARGRKLALTTMSLLLPLGGLIRFASHPAVFLARCIGDGIISFCIVTVVYLFLPSIRARFRTETAPVR